MPLWISLFICKGDDADQFLRRNDFAIYPLAPPLLTVRQLHGVKKSSARAKFQFGDVCWHPFRSPPVVQARRLGKRLPHQFAWRVENPRNGKFLVASGICLL